MTILNEEFNFTYEMPEEYEEIKREDYSKYSIDPSTIFVYFNKKKESTISLNRDSDVSDQKEYEDIIELNASNLKKVGMDVVSVNPTNLKSPSEYAVYVMKSTFKSIEFSIYFFVIREMACAISVQVNSNQEDKVVERIIESIKVLAD